MRKHQHSQPLAGSRGTSTLKKRMVRDTESLQSQELLECKNSPECNETQPIGATKRVTLQFK